MCNTAVLLASPLQNGDGYVDSDAKLQKIVSAIREQLK